MPKTSPASARPGATFLITAKVKKVRMPDLGNRANVMGPQPLGPVKQADPEMVKAVDRLLAALIAGDKAAVLALSHDSVRERMAQIADAARKGSYDRSEIVGRARVVEHYFVKARLLGPNQNQFLVQFRVGSDRGKWTVREAV